LQSAISSARTEIVGVQSAQAPACARSLEVGHIVQLDTRETNADVIDFAAAPCDHSEQNILIGAISQFDWTYSGSLTMVSPT
jgi:hypothetical protein